MSLCLYVLRLANVYLLSSIFMVSVSTVQKEVISLKIMHEKVCGGPRVL